MFSYIMDLIGTFSTMIGATTVSSCTVCAAGSFSVVGSTKCTTCPVDTYATAGVSTCIHCPNNAFAPSGSGVASDCQCYSGFVSYDGGQSCVACPVGLSSGSIGAYCFRKLGTGHKESLDGQWAVAAFSYPSGIVGVNTTSTIVSDYGSHTLRIIRLDLRTVQTIVGAVGRASWQDGVASAARFNHPMGLAIGRTPSEILVADGFNHRIRSVNLQSLLVSTVAGTGYAGAVDGQANASQVNFPSALAVQDEVVYVTDMYNNRLRRVDLASGLVSTLVEGFAYPLGVGLVYGSPYIAVSDQLNQRQVQIKFDPIFVN